MHRNARGTLAPILEAKQRELEALHSRRAELRRGAETAAPTRDFESALRGDQVRLIAEFKRRSPSAGWIQEFAEVGTVVRGYETAGAAALSILTDREFFAGGLLDLQNGRNLTRLPVLRKDFILDEIQLYESRAAGADAVLLIVRILDDEQLRDLLAAARGLGLGVLVEAHNEAESETALAAGASVLGVNNRDLDNLRTDTSTVMRVLPLVPANVILVAESGVRGKADVDRFGDAGIDAVLVGEWLMRQPDPRTAAHDLTMSPRSARLSTSPA